MGTGASQTSWRLPTTLFRSQVVCPQSGELVMKAFARHSPAHPASLISKKEQPWLVKSCLHLTPQNLLLLQPSGEGRRTGLRFRHGAN